MIAFTGPLALSDSPEPCTGRQLGAVWRNQGLCPGTHVPNKGALVEATHGRASRYTEMHKLNLGSPSLSVVRI